MYDSILFLNRLADYRTSSLSTRVIRKIAEEVLVTLPDTCFESDLSVMQVSPLAAGGSIELNNDLKGRLYNNYNVIDLADQFLSKVEILKYF